MSADYIKNKNLHTYKYGGKLLETDDATPIEIFIGTIWMIKNNSIIEFYSYYSLERMDIRFSGVVEPYYMCNIQMVNIDQCDIKDFTSNSIFDEDMTSYSTEKTVEFVKTLNTVGFKLYTCRL